MPKPKLWNFNITEDERGQIAIFQNNVCAICKKNLGEKGQILALFIDHCHKTGLIRGLLCFTCNRRIADLTLEDLANFKAYLINPPATQVLGAPRFGLPGRVGTKKQRKLYNKLQKAKEKSVDKLQNI